MNRKIGIRPAGCTDDVEAGSESANAFAFEKKRARLRFGLLPADFLNVSEQTLGFGWQGIKLSGPVAPKSSAEVLGFPDIDHSTEAVEHPVNTRSGWDTFEKRSGETLS